MKTLTLITGTVLALGMGTAALAQQVIASDPQTLVTFFFDEGIPAQLTTDNVGDPLVEFRYEGNTQQVYFYDCTDNVNCQSIQFYTTLAGGPAALEAINDWNSDSYRFTRAYVYGGEDTRVEMDIFTGFEGISSGDLRSMFQTWLQRVAEFQGMMGG